MLIANLLSQTMLDLAVVLSTLFLVTSGIMFCVGVVILRNILSDK
jgi:hypothetical protein